MAEKEDADKKNGSVCGRDEFGTKQVGWMQPLPALHARPELEKYKYKYKY